MPPRVISQKGWVKGLIAATGIVNQPPNSVRRISNFVLDKRGGLRTTDGSKIISQFTGIPLSSLGPWIEISLFQPVGVNLYYIGLLTSPSTHLSTPTMNSLTSTLITGGTLVPGTTYAYQVTALDGVGGETIASPEMSLVLAAGNNAIVVKWNTVSNATGYNIYGRTVAAEMLLASNIQVSISPGNITDNGSISPSGAFPISDTTTQTLLFKIVPSQNIGSSLFTFPANKIIGIGGPLGSIGASLPPGGGAGLNPMGGIVGTLSPIPQAFQFGNQMVLCLGNGVSPYLFSDPSTVAAISNTFSAIYPSWVASATYKAGDLIQATVNTVQYVFMAIQGGISAAAVPAFTATTGKTVTDNQVIWKNTGQVTGSPAPRGAGCGIVYAGALWLGNTNPTTTSDALDGPSSIRMSDLNNPLSWNPLNQAFLDKDDGDQITGFATFTVTDTGIPPAGWLFAFKNFSAFQILGTFGSTGFQLQKLQTDQGCIAPRSLQFLPGLGIARLTHLGISIINGVRDNLISEEIRPYLFGTEPDIVGLDWSYAYFSKGTQVADPPLYVLAVPLLGNSGALTRIFVYDLVLKSWTIIDLPFSISTLKQFRAGGTIPITVAGNFVDGTIRRLLSLDSDWDGTSISWSFQTQPVFNDGANTPVFYRRILIKGSGLTPPITGTVSYDGASQSSSNFNVQQISGRQFIASLDLMTRAKLAYVVISGSGKVDIESVDWHVVDKPIGATLQFA